MTRYTSTRTANLKWNQCNGRSHVLLFGRPNLNIKQILQARLVNQTWCKDLSPCLLFFLADEVTLLRSLYTINVSSLSAQKNKDVLNAI